MMSMSCHVMSCDCHVIVFYVAESIYPSDRRTVRQGPSDQVDCYHTLPLPPTHHLPHRRPVVGSGPEMTSTRERTRHGLCDSRLYSGSRSSTLSTSNLRDVLDSPVALTGGGAGGAGGGGNCIGEGCCGMRRDGCSDACSAMLGGGGGKVGPFGSDVQPGRAKQQHQQQASSARVHFSSPIGYNSFSKDVVVGRFNVFNNNNTSLEGAIERVQVRSTTTDNR